MIDTLKDILGNTIEKIARNKGGIIKFPAPVVLGPKLPLSLLEGIAQVTDCSFCSL